MLVAIVETNYGPTVVNDLATLILFSCQTAEKETFHLAYKNCRQKKMTSLQLASMEDGLAVILFIFSNLAVRRFPSVMQVIS